MELIDILDENGNKIGIKDREDAFRDGNFLRAVHLWIYSPKKNKILIQKRSSKKKYDKNKWDLTCGGHVKAGEDSITAIIRETKEEIGIDISSENFIKLYEEKYIGSKKYFFDVYFLEKDLDINDLVLQEEEVQDIKYFLIEELENMYNTGTDFVKQCYIEKFIKFLKEYTENI